MRGLESLRSRLKYYGGISQKSRMDRDKQHTLREACRNRSCQTAIIRNCEGIDFNCLINPDKLNMDYDNKTIAILYQDLPINVLDTEQERCTNVKVGDVITWVNNNTKWLVYLQSLDETAYFKAQLRRCKYYIAINNHAYWFYFLGPTETQIQWIQRSNDYVNLLNYSAVMYISKTPETEDYFHRFTKIKIGNRPWEVQVVDLLTYDGIIEIRLKEDFSNTPAEWAAANEEPKEETETYILGDNAVKPYDIKIYKAAYPREDGVWSINNKTAKIVENSYDQVKIEIITGRSGCFDLTYSTNLYSFTLPITIKSL